MCIMYLKAEFASAFLQGFYKSFFKKRGVNENTINSMILNVGKIKIDNVKASQ